VASQVDVGPSIMALLGFDEPTQAYGRNLFSPALKDEGFAVIKPSGSEEVVALIEGDRLLMRDPKSRPKLFRYSLETGSTQELTSSASEQVRQMERRLLAYVQTGILNLRMRQVGVPAP